MRNGDIIEAVSQNGVGDAVTIKISCLSGSKFSVQINLDSTVASFKSLLVRNSDIPVDEQRLIYKGRILKDDQTLQSYGLEADHTVHLIRGFPSTTTTNADGSNGSGALSGSQTNTRDVSSSDDAGWLGGGGDDDLRASLFPGLDLAGFDDDSDEFFGADPPDFDQLEEQQIWSNQYPNLMDRSGLRNLMDYYTVIFENLVMYNPQTRDMLDRNPELAYAINNPSTLYRILDAERESGIMRDMTRNSYRRMNNIEISPEDFNMLRRMYRIVRQPFLNAATLARTTGTTPSSPAPYTTNSLPNTWSSSAGGYAPTIPARPDYNVNARPPAAFMLGGLVIPAFGVLFGPMQIINSPNQSVQNPAISPLTQSLQPNPQIMNQALGLSPQLGILLGSSSQRRETMQNSQFPRHLTSPEMMQPPSTLPRFLLSPISRPQSNQWTAQTGRGAGRLNNTSLEALTTMFGGLGAGSLGGPSRTYVPPEQLYAAQLSQLRAMGFMDTQENIEALIACAGNVSAAVGWLLGNFGHL